jgi:hypothetical protein
VAQGVDPEFKPQTPPKKKDKMKKKFLTQPYLLNLVMITILFNIFILFSNNCVNSNCNSNTVQKKKI